MDEKELKKMIEKQTEEMSVPKSLEPAQIEKMLQEKGKRKQKSAYGKVAVLAACGVLVIGLASVGGMFGGIFGNSDNTLTETSMDRAQSTAAESAEEAGRDVDSSAGGGKGELEVKPIRAAKDYDEIYDYLEAVYEKKQEQEIIYESSERKSMLSDGVDTGAAMEESAVAMDADMAAPAESGSGSYSDTNVREEGIGEADIVKTDGKNLYIVNNRKIQIVGIEEEEMDPLGTIRLGEETSISEIYVKDDRLVVLYTYSDFIDQADVDQGEYGGYYRDFTVAETFDVSKPQKPKSMGKISQSGSYHTMRAAGDYIYLFSDFYVDLYSAKPAMKRYIPEVQGERIASSDILMPWGTEGNKYTVVSAFSMKDPGKKTDSKAIFGNAGMCYVSGSNIYVSEEKWESGQTEQTSIRKVSYQDGKLEAVGQVLVDGTLHDSFCIDEYEGNLRLVVTVRAVEQVREPGILPLADREEETQTDSNSLYILDENLKELARIEGLAPDERIYSARLMGDAGYFVTYREMDPLFSVDLSDPKNPEIIGKLKIPGFSEYLHPYGEGLLLGIGMEVDETGTTTQGVKLSMFDISDPANVEEVQKYVLENTYSTDVAYNYKAAFVDPGKNLIGFAAYGDEMKYYIFSYEEDGFMVHLERDLTGFSSDVRILYSDDRLYLVSGNTVESYDMKSFEKIDDIVL